MPTPCILTVFILMSLTLTLSFSTLWTITQRVILKMAKRNPLHLTLTLRFKHTQKRRRRRETANGVTQEIVKSSQVATVVIDEQIAPEWVGGGGGVSGR